MKKQIRVSFRISSRLHSLMRVLYLRYRDSRGLMMGGFYQEALTQWVSEQGPTPKYSEVVQRTKVEVTLPADAGVALEAIQRFAADRRVPEATLIEEALTNYLERAENYLDQDVYRRHRRKLRHYE